MQTYEADAKLAGVLNDLFPSPTADAFQEALSNWMEAHKQDVYDRVKQTGDWDPDY